MTSMSISPATMAGMNCSARCGVIARSGDDTGGLDLANALRDELGLHRFAVDLLHAARRFFDRRIRDLFENRVGIFVAGPETLEVEHPATAEAADLDRGRRADDAIHRRRPERQLELVGVELATRCRHPPGSRVRRLGTIAMSSKPYARRPDLPSPISISATAAPLCPLGLVAHIGPALTLVCEAKRKRSL